MISSTSEGTAQNTPFMAIRKLPSFTENPQLEKKEEIPSSKLFGLLTSSPPLSAKKSKSESIIQTTSTGSDYNSGYG